MMARILFALIVFLPIYAMGASAGAEHHGIPWKTIGIQLLNFSILAGLLIFLLKNGVVAHFKERKESYLDLVGKAEKAKKEAQAHHQQITARLKELENSAQENVQKAQQEAEALKNRLLKEADELVERLKMEAQKTTEVELQKAKSQIRSFALAQSIQTAQEKLAKEASEDDQSRLQSEFIKKIQAVTQ